MAKRNVVALSGLIEPYGRLMAERDVTALSDLITKHEAELLTSWMRNQLEAGSLRSGQIKEEELQDQSRRFLREFSNALQSGDVDDVTGNAWSATRDLLGSFSRSRAQQGFTPSETATFIFSMKEPVFTLLRNEIKDREQQLADLTWAVTKVLDKLGLYTAEVYAQTREGVIKRQTQELIELSTPVVELWDKIILVPLIGTLDSERAQVVMENLLNHIVKSGAEIAIIDIMGVPTVDTQVAQHIVKTISATRLMGADCIISGIRPQIAQTIVHLGLQLDVISKATMADAFALALKRTKQTVGRVAGSP
jgi:rsbT co-antagonist protein RsbR